MPKTNEEFLNDVVLKIGLIGFGQARRAINSRTLREHLDLFVDAVGEAVLNVPHYWAVHYHDGRGPVKARPGHKLVWFANPEEDPRLTGGYPKEKADVRRLTRAQFQNALRRNLQARRQGKAPPVIITTFSVGTDPELFFDNNDGMRGFKNKAFKTARNDFSKHVRDTLNEEGLLNDKDTAVGHLF